MGTQRVSHHAIHGPSRAQSHPYNTTHHTYTLPPPKKINKTQVDPLFLTPVPPSPATRDKTPHSPTAMPISPEESEGEEEEGADEGASITASAASGGATASTSPTPTAPAKTTAGVGPSHFYLPVLQRTLERRGDGDGGDDDEGGGGACYFAKALECVLLFFWCACCICV